MQIDALHDWIGSDKHEWLAGIENAHLLLADHRKEVEELIDAIHRVLVRKTELLCAHSPADVFYLIENTSTTLISPEQFRRYCLRHVGEYAAIVRGAGRRLPELCRELCRRSSRQSSRRRFSDQEMQHAHGRYVPD